MHTVPEPDPLQEVCDIFPIVIQRFADDSEREGYVFPCRQVVEQTEILKNDADAAAKLRTPLRGDVGDILIEQMDLAT